MSGKTLYFIRHGQTEWNAIRRMQGQWNSDLNDLGRAQAGENGRLLARLKPDALYCSPLDRTRQTADIIRGHIDLPVTYDDRLKEWDSGDWSGHMYADLPDKWPDEWAAWRAAPFNARAPGGENYADMFARARPFIDELLATPHASIAIVSHGMIGKVMVAILAGWDEATTLAVGQKNDVVFRVAHASSGVDVQYYESGQGPHDGLPGMHPDHAQAAH